MSDKYKLPAGALALLPDDDATMRCADFAEMNALDPAGTAIAAAGVVLVETPLPWPKPVFAHDHLQGLSSMVDTGLGRVRVLAAVPQDNADLRCLVFAPTVDGANRSTIHRPTDLPAFVAGLGTDAPDTDAVESGPDRALLICTQGSHDVCCGSEGPRLANALDDRLDAAVFRVSHTGGHRFAPTLMSLPDGRMWAWMTPDDVVSVVERDAAELTRLAPLCRGWWGAPTGPAQVAERAVLAKVGFELDDVSRSVSVSANGDDTWDCVVTADGVEHRVLVGLGRIVPSIACRTLGGLPAKPGREYVVLRGPY